MRALRFILAAGILLITASSAMADYLVVSRNANIRKDPSGSAAILATALKGDTLVLISGNQENGYFHVRISADPGHGWIYRTLVRRYEGEASPVITTEDLSIRVFDVGAGLCAIARLPGNHFLVFDAGHYNGKGSTTFNQVSEFIPAGSIIDEMVISHNDADHIGAAWRIIKAYQVKKLVFTGYERSMVSSNSPTGSYDSLMAALSQSDRPETVVNLHSPDSVITPGTTETFGDVSLVFLCGFGKPLPGWDLDDNAERLNSVSIVAKLEYHGVSVLFPGDAVGRHKDDEPDALIATEQYLVENAGPLLNSDILIAPHHGGNNASTPRFIAKVSPDVVIFSAGHDYNHPTRAAADRYLESVSIINMFRTDRGDDESGSPATWTEWDYGRIEGCIDSHGDDDVVISISKDGTYKVAYVRPNAECGE